MVYGAFNTSVAHMLYSLGPDGLAGSGAMLVFRGLPVRALVMLEKLGSLVENLRIFNHTYSNLPCCKGYQLMLEVPEMDWHPVRGELNS